MIEFLISSTSRRKILIYLLNHPDKQYYLRELSRKLDEPAPVIKRELDKLDQIGFIVSWVQGNQRRFQVNKNFLFLPELKSLIDKTEILSAGHRVIRTIKMEEGLKKRRIWKKRSMEIVNAYGENMKRQRPRHPAEARMLEMLT